MRYYAVYQGNEFLCKGTIQEVAEILGIGTSAIYKLSAPCYLKNKGPKAKWAKKLHDDLSEYALYKGEDILTTGTVFDLSEFLEVKPSTIRFMATPAYIKRKKPGGDHLLVVKVELDEEDFKEIN